MLGGRFTCYAVNRNPQPDNDLLSPPALTRVAELVSCEGGYDLVVTDEFTACAGKSPDIRWSMTTPATAEIISDNCISLTQGGKTMYLTASEASGAELTMFVRDANTGQAWDEPNEGISLVGFEGKMQDGDNWKLTTVLSASR